MAEENVLLTISRAKDEIVDTIRAKTFWDRVLPTLQILLLVLGGGWAVARYYIDRYDRSHRPANIEISPTIEDLGVHDGLRFVKVQIIVRNSGSRAFVINSPYTIRAFRLKGARPGRWSEQTWDGSYATTDASHVLRSGETFGRGFWFEPAERDVRSFVLAMPEGVYNAIEVHAAVRHAKREDDSVHTKWEPQPDHSLRAVTIVLSKPGEGNEYSRSLHPNTFRRDAIAMNDGVASLGLWPVSASSKVSP